MQINKKKRRKPKAFLKRYGRVLIGGAIIAALVLIGLFAPLIATHNPYTTNIAEAKQAPSDEHLMGTDHAGRDIFSRVVYGTQISLILPVGIQLLIISIGTVCGLLCGYFRRVDDILMRVMEAIHSLPQLLLSLVIASVLGEGVFKMMIALVVGGLPGITRMVRSQVLSLREKEFVESEKAMGASNARVIFLHILPHCSNYLIIRFCTGLGTTILSLAALAYLGVGLDPTIPNWGGIISEAQSSLMAYPYMSVYPGVAIIIAVFGFTMLGEGVREILDPKLK